MENNKYEYVRVVPIRAGMKIFPTDGTTFEQLKEELEKSGFTISCDTKELSIYIASAPEGSTNPIETLDLDKYAQRDCAKCNSYRTCIKAALNGTLIRCICFGKIKSEVEEAVNKFNSIPEEYRLSREEIEQLIYETTRK